MSSYEKLLKQFLKKPESLKYKEIENLLIRLGFEKIDGKGSHKKFKHKTLRYNFIIPIHNNECKKVYKKRLSKFIRKTFYYNE